MEQVIFRVSDTLNKRETVKKGGETFVFTSSSRFASPLASTTSKRGTLVVLVVVRRRRSAFV